MALSNTAVPYYYGRFRDAVIRGEIPVCKEIEMEMNRIDDLIANPGVYYDDKAVEGWIKYCENELTLTDGSDLHMLDSFKLWGEQIFGWYYFTERSVYVPNEDGHGGHYVNKRIKKRLVNKQYLIVARGAAKSMYASCIQSFFLNCDTATTHQITTAPTMKQAEEVMSPIRTSIVRARGPLFKFLTEGSLQNTTGSKANRMKLAATKKGIENFLTGSLLEIRPMKIDKLQGLRVKCATVDEWLSGDTREDPIGAIEQGAAKEQGSGENNDYVIVATSSEGTVRNGCGDTIKMELMQILKGDFIAPNVSIWYYRLDNLDEVGDPEMWLKANPNLACQTYHDRHRKASVSSDRRIGVRCRISLRYDVLHEWDDVHVHEYTRSCRHRSDPGCHGLDHRDGHDVPGDPCSIGHVHDPWCIYEELQGCTDDDPSSCSDVHDSHVHHHVHGLGESSTDRTVPVIIDPVHPSHDGGEQPDVR